MEIEFDPDKSARNVARRGLGFELVAQFDFDAALVLQDDRQDYGDPLSRHRAIAGQAGDGGVYGARPRAAGHLAAACKSKGTVAL